MRFNDERIVIRGGDSGIGGSVSVREMTVGSWDETMNGNLRGPSFAVPKALRLMQRRAAIVLTSSIGHVKGLPGNSHYCAATAGIRSLARSYGVDLVVDAGHRVGHAALECPHRGAAGGGRRGDRLGLGGVAREYAAACAALTGDLRAAGGRATLTFL